MFETRFIHEFTGHPKRKFGGESLNAPVRRSVRGEPLWEIATLFPPPGTWTEEALLVRNKTRLTDAFDEPQWAASARVTTSPVSFPTAFRVGLAEGE
jgi:hypothetical protein